MSDAEADRTLVTSRLIDAPPARVFEAFADPALLAPWWGPGGLASTFEEFDFRPGGRWRFVMHGPGGANFSNESVFAEVERPARIVIRHESAPRFELAIALEERSGKTLVGWRQVFPTAADCRRIAALAAPANEQNLDRLAAVVREES